MVADPATRALVTNGRAVFDRLDEQGPAGDQDCGYDHHLQLPMIETRTGVCDSLAQVCAELQQLLAVGLGGPAALPRLL